MIRENGTMIQDRYESCSADIDKIGHEAPDSMQ